MRLPLSLLVLPVRVAPPFGRAFHSRPHCAHSQCLQLPDKHVDAVCQDQLALYSPVDALRLALLNDMRPLLNQSDHPAPSFPQSIQFPINGQMLALPTFRQALASKPYTKHHRKVIREQLLRCNTPRDVLRVFAVALQHKETTQELSRMHHYIVRALYRSRDKVTDAKILETINVIVSRFRLQGLPLSPYLLAIGIKFAARARSLPGMKRYLKLYRELGFPMSRNLFRAIIAKCSIGYNGFGEIRNGRWIRRDLLQVLLGYQDCPPSDQHHLGLFLDRQEWTQLHGWLAILSRCKASDQIWSEWLLWLQNPLRLNPRLLQVPDKQITSKTKGDYWFIESMAFSGDTQRAWLMLKESGIPYSECRPSLRFKLIQDLENATLWHDQISTDLLEHYTSEITKIENALGVEWISLSGENGYHRPTASLQSSLEDLSNPDFKLEPDYGYPYDLSPEETGAQRDMIKLEVEDVASDDSANLRTAHRTFREATSV